MRTLPSALLAAQKSASAAPYVKIEIAGRIGGIRHLDWQRLYSGGEADSYHAATMSGDGSLIRCRVDSGSLYLQRVSSPGPGSNFSNWTFVDSAANADVALASRAAEVLLFYVGTNGRTIYLRESNDYGASFGSATAITTAAAAVGWLAADIKGDNTVLLIYSVGGTVYAVKRSGTTWGSPAAWTNSLAAVSGLACQYEADFDVVASGSDAQGAYKVWTCIYGDGYSQAVDTWSPLREMAVASAGSNMEFRAPFLAYPDVFRLTFVEKYTGSESYSRPYFSFSPATADYVNNLWREPVPMNLTSDYGLAIAYSTSDVWLTTPWGVWQASLTTPALDVTADVLDLTAETDPNGSRLRLVLRNDDGRYLDLSGEKAVIKGGGEVRVSPGYQTASGPLASSGPAYWIEGWEYTSGEGQATLVLHARDAWQLLESWRARRQYAWAQGEKNAFQLLSFVMARASLEFSSAGSSSVVTDLYPSFTIHPGESGATAVRRLLAVVPDVIFFRGHFAYIKNLLSSEASDYSYGTEHVVFRGRYGSQRPQANRVQVFGDGPFVEAFGWDEIEDAYDRVRQVHDLNLDTVARAQDRADAEMLHQEIASSSGEMVVPVNCGQELYDAISITDQSGRLTDARRRVLGLSMRYSAGGRVPVYEQRLSLGAV
ncbi:MAG: hypothetical protein AMJ38_03220 [Dehalococcoidia bacterium DG_22]|nr:MAG: hypothetical protein AMJ38_03220 [Dehalococcoidia bacterium DG_22]